MKKRKWKGWILLILLLILILNSGNIGRLIYPVKYMNYIKIYATEYQVDPYLIMSIVKAESNFNKDAVSSKSATGLMQITEPTALWLAERMSLSDFRYEDVKDPAINIRMGCCYFSYLLSLYEGNVKNALVAYNAGEGTVKRWLNDPSCSKDGKTLSAIPYPETSHYVSRVMNHYKMYPLLYSHES